MKFIDILRDHLDTFNQAYEQQITSSMRQAIYAMLSCRTNTERNSHWACQGCSHTADFPLSCGHRSCSQCQHNTTQDWLNKQQTKLLPVEYFMVTFTLPFELRAVAKSHPEQVYQAMFTVAASVLKDFAHNSKSLGGKIGFTGVLHTHNRRRDYHPHLHFIIPAGSFNKDKKQWQKSRGKYLFNAFNLAKVWRARLMEYLINKLDTTLPSAIPKKWVVDCQHVGKGLPALKYLSRYLYRGVLPDKSIIGMTDGKVSFKYQDSQSQTTRIRTLPVTDFLWLVLQHVLPKGLRRVRDYGLLSGNFRKLRQQIQLMFAVAGTVFPLVEEAKRLAAIRPCPCCQQPMTFMGIYLNRRPMSSTITA
ncbi:IS91 family transposase [Shewanella schlegeliana]|uniref:IS91 family transposase n=1 Tax=Shewanella schlegeliana TaxID=190308 RepID=A0ABS1T2P6_9GAMM|nr:IS91 family transposase [Shewanella schlegeliana]MBL4915073.1 IS91 family transposase [Shewanella schlegeliana]MCL1111061.1 IS91 family transposase [Shewanella schlegeliana]